MRKILIISCLLLLSTIAKAGLDITVSFAMFADGKNGGTSGANIISGKSGLSIQVTNESLPGCVKTEADSKLNLSVTVNASRCVVKFATGVFDECSPGAKVGDVIQVKVTITDPTSPYVGRVGVMKYKLSTGSFNAFKDPSLGYTEGDVVDGATSNTDKYGMDLPGAKPTISVTGTSLCAGETGKTVTATFTNAPADIATGGYTIDWGISGITTSGALSTTGATGSVATAATASGKAQLKKADGTVMAESAEYTVTVNPKPTLTISPAVAGRSVCSGQGMTLTAALSPDGTTYTWKQGGTVKGNSAALSTGNLTADATYTVSGESAAGCKSDEETVTVKVKPVPTATLAVDKENICKDPSESITLTAGPTGAGYSYTWSGVSSSTNVATATPAATTTYGVKVTKDGCTSAEVKKTVTVHTVTVTPSGSPDPVTYNGTTVVTANPVFSGGHTAATYTWTAGDIDGATTGSSVTSNPLTTPTKFTVEVTDNAGCKGSGSVTVGVSGSGLAVNPTGGGTFCSADLPKTLKAGDTGGSGAVTYEWTSTPAGLVLSSTSIQQPDVQNTSAEGVYTVNVKVIKGVETKTGSLTVTVNKTPQLGTVTANPSSIAEGASSQLTLSSVDPTTLTPVWSSTNGGPLAGTSGMTVSTGTINTAGTYQYKVTATNKGCSADKPVSLTVTGGVTPPPVPEITIVPPTVPPSGNTNTPIGTEVTVSGGDGDYVYVWTSPDPDVTITDKGNGNVDITSSTPGTKEVCVEVSSAGKMKKECFNVVVTEPEPGKVDLKMSVDTKCAYAGEYLTIIIVGSGADTYSFVLRDKSNNPVMTVPDKASWDPHKVYLNVDPEGYYKITDFKYKIGGVESKGIEPDPLFVQFDPVPNVYANADHLGTISHCQGELLTLKGSGDAGLQYVWDRNVADGVPFDPVTSGTYTVTGTNPQTGCKNTSTVKVEVNSKPSVTPPLPQEICEGDLVTLKATGSTDATFTWNNGVINDQPFKPSVTATYEVTATNPAGCTATATTTVTVNQKPYIVRTSKNPRNIAIGKDVYFAVTAEGRNMTYQWKKKENGVWVNMQDITNNTPIIIGTHTDSLSLLNVPQSWDGSEFRLVISGDCGKDSTEFQLGVRECFTISTELVMWEGIIPDETPGNKIDGWYCRGQRIALKAVITSEEGYEIENAHYKWSIDGLDIPEEHIELESDTAILTWIPEFTEDDIVVKVCAYSDGACEEICPKYMRLKAREFENVAVKIMTDKDPDHLFCAGDTVNFWLATKNAGEKPVYTWYNDVFELPEEESPRNEVIHYENEKVTMVMGQEDTWMRVVMTPSAEVCMRDPVFIDTVFMKKKPWMEPSLHIDCSDTLVCKGDTVSMWAIQANAGSKPTFEWQRSIGDPFPDWNLGTEYYATVHVDEEDVWVKCTMTPSADVCYDNTKPIVDAVRIAVFKQDAVVTISCDMEDKKAGDELVFESEVENILGEPRYEWYVDEMLAPVSDEEYVSSSLKQGSVVYCMVSGEKVCQTRVKSNEIVVDYGKLNRDTMLVIYKDERIRDLNMAKEGDHPGSVIFMIESPAKYGIATIDPVGMFSYTPNSGFVGTDDVKYIILNRSDKTVLAEGYIYITVKESDRFFVPNLITPNDDGLNDTWKLDFISDYPDHLIQVFDRNGKVVFEGRNYQNDWGGEGMAKSGYVGHINLVNGVYTYIIDLGDKEKTVLKSWIEIRANLNRRDYR